MRILFLLLAILIAPDALAFSASSRGFEQGVRIPEEELKALVMTFGNAFSSRKTLPGNCALQDFVASEAGSSAPDFRFTVLQDRSATFEVVRDVLEYTKAADAEGIRTRIQRRADLGTLAEPSELARETLELTQGADGTILRLLAVRESYDSERKEWVTREFFDCGGSLEPVAEIAQPVKISQDEFHGIASVLASGPCTAGDPEFRSDAFGEPYLALTLLLPAPLPSPPKTLFVPVYAASTRFEKLDMGNGRNELILEQFQQRKSAQPEGRTELYAYDRLKLTIRYQAATSTLESVSVDVSYAGIPDLHAYVAQQAGTCEAIAPSSR